MHFGCSKHIIRLVCGPSLLMDSAELFVAYYIPPSDIKAPLEKTFRQSYCEWKGFASYFSIPSPDGGVVEDRIWTYKSPSPGFKDIKDYVSFYAGPWDCYVDGEKVEPQPGGTFSMIAHIQSTSLTQSDFYGGWKTSDIVGKIKGAPGTLGW